MLFKAVVLYVGILLKMFLHETLDMCNINYNFMIIGLTRLFENKYYATATVP